MTDERVSKWMREIHWFDLEGERDWKKFVNQLHSPPQLERIPFMAPDVPDGFVDRPAEFGQLVKQVLASDGKQPLAITTALHGAGGFGKTTLATKLCHEDDVVMEFVDGILWVTLGESPNVLAELTGAYGALTGERPGFGSEFDASSALAEKLEHRRCLLVIDDVWNQAHLQPFLRGAAKCTRLITTRQVDIAVGARCEQPVLVDEMRPEEAVAMLEGDDQRDESGKLADLADRLGEWPLMLELARSAIRKRMQLRNESWCDALDYVTRLLQKRGVTGLEIRNDASRQASVQATMDISLQHLDDADREAAVELAVFAEDVDIPPLALGALWDADEFDVEARIDQLAASSLIRLNTGDGTIRLHDVVREYLGTQLTDAPAVHARLIEDWTRRSGSRQDFRPSPAPNSSPNSRPTEDSPKLLTSSATAGEFILPDTFAWQWIGYHLLESGQSDRLRDLLFDPEWLDARIAEVHPNRIIADAERWMELAEAHRSYARQSEDKTTTGVQPDAHALASVATTDDMRLLRDAIRLSSYLTADDPNQLAGQLVGRLLTAAETRPAITAFLDRIHTTRRRPTLLPRNPVLNQAGGPLIRTLIGHSDEVHSVCVTPDGRRAISASDDQTLKVWDVATGQELRTLCGHSGGVRNVCVTSDGRHAISASDDQTLKVWDVATGQELWTLSEHSNWVRSVCVTPDGRHAISASYDQTLKVWDVVSGRELRTLSGHSDWVRSVCTTPNGRHAVSASLDQTLKVWDVATGQELCTLSGHSREIYSVCVTPDGGHVISASADQTLKIWHMAAAVNHSSPATQGLSVSRVRIAGDSRHALTTEELLRDVRGHVCRERDRLKFPASR